MSTASCVKCGAELVPGTKFCRRCGQPSSLLPSAGVLEAPTQEFGAAPPVSGPTRHLNTISTGPAYVSPAAPMPEPALATQGFRPTGAKPAMWVLLGVAVGLLVGVAILAAVWFNSRSDIPAPEAIARPADPPALPGHPAIPVPPAVPVPPLPPPPAGAGGSTPISRSLIYPGAETIMDMSRGEEGSVLHLSSTDPVDKVARWYIAKLRPGKRVNIPGGTVLQSGKIAVVINGMDEGTSILIKQEP